MPVVVEGGRIPPRWADRKSSQAVISIDGYGAKPLTIGFVNNMPDPALEDTEMQFFELLDESSGGTPVHVKLYSLPGIPRGDRGQAHSSSYYFDFDDLWNTHFDAIIVTGTEPRSPSLRDEPYWSVLADLLDWAERNTSSAILSCLAAHASVLHSDGIGRHRLNDKQFGVFGFSKVADHMMTDDAGALIHFPHSRWNEVREDSLNACGYVVLTKSVEAGVDSFVKRKKNSLFVHFQGHPEYNAHTLLKEYRRDIKRFLRSERETYPTMPRGYFDSTATRLLADFQETALSNPHEEVMAEFPETAVVSTLQNGWHACAVSLYRNWLQYVRSRNTETSAFMATTASDDHQQRKCSAAK
jgi:homoserine O-succinyltransferase/O-acetyltransferase